MKREKRVTSAALRDDVGTFVHVQSAAQKSATWFTSHKEELSSSWFSAKCVLTRQAPESVRMVPRHWNPGNVATPQCLCAVSDPTATDTMAVLTPSQSLRQEERLSHLLI